MVIFHGKMLVHQRVSWWFQWIYSWTMQTYPNLQPMVLVYLPTKLGHWLGVNVGKYSMHGASGIYLLILIHPFRQHGIKAAKNISGLQHTPAILCNIWRSIYHQQIYSFHPVTNAVIQPVVTNFTRKPALGATISLPANRTCHLYRQFRRKFPRKKAPIAWPLVVQNPWWLMISWGIIYGGLS